MGRQWVFVGTSTAGNSQGIYRFQFDPANGAVDGFALAAEAENPTFLALHPNGRFLYAVNAIADFGGENTGAVSSFAIDTATGELTLLNQQPSAGPGPCHLVVDLTGRHVLVANYVGGSVASLSVNDDGTLTAPHSIFQHEGSSLNPDRQEGPHAHSINLDAANHFALAVDLGLDQVRAYRFDAVDGTLTPHEPPFASLKPGAGPRHLAFHPSGRFAYVINELDSTVTAFAYDPEAGNLSEIQTIPTLPEEFTEENYPSEILVDPSGRFLYGSNRGHDSLATYRIDRETGLLSLLAYQPSGGAWPRNFNFDLSGAWMIVGNQNSDNMLVFRFDPETGALTQAGPTREAPAAICFKMLPVG